MCIRDSIEVIATMARRFVQNVWPELFPQLIQHIQQAQTMSAQSVLFDCVKKICKKYRFLVRSDDLFREMNYVIENFSEHLLRSLVQATETVANQNLDEQGIRTAFSVINASLHIIESILGQEELPDFYEE